MITIRALTVADLEAVAMMIHALNQSEGYDASLGPSAPDVGQAFLGSHRGGDCAVADKAGVLVGYVTWHTTYETTTATRSAYIGDLFVVDEHRRQGIGRRLLGVAAAAVQQAGGRHLWWTALPRNQAGQAFYEKLGAKGQPVIAYALTQDAFARLATHE